MTTRQFEGAGFKVGDRVQVHPGHDRYMMGDRYGDVVAISHHAASNDPIRIQVKLDRSRQSIWFRPDYLMHVNPLSGMQWYLIAAGVVGVVVVAYEMIKAPAASASANTIVLQPGPQSATIGTGLTVTLPVGALWPVGNPSAGTNTPIVVPAAAAALKGQTQPALPITWLDANSVTQTTQLTLTA